MASIKWGRFDGASGRLSHHDGEHGFLLGETMARVPVFKWSLRTNFSETWFTSSRESSDDSPVQPRSGSLLHGSHQMTPCSCTGVK